MSYDFVVVGAGLFGSTFARAAADRRRKVLVVDRLPHVGGMCYTERKHGVLLHAYGPHVFHTNDPDIWAWINRFASFYPFMVRTKALHQGRIYTLPINLMTFHELWGVVTPAEAEKKLASVRVSIEKPATIEEWALAQWGPEVYEKLILHYTLKQWGRDPKDLPAAILKRLPARMTFDDNYFTDRYQGLPEGGYTPLFERMLEGIEVRLGVDFHADQSSFARLGRVIYSGRIDRYFDYRLGPLDFRSCRFLTEFLPGDAQGNPVIHHTDRSVPWTRTIEHKHFEDPGLPITALTREHPFETTPDTMPLYPVNDHKNMELLEKYQALDGGETVFGGRLGAYRYRDMHHVIGEALALADRLC